MKTLYVVIVNWNGKIDTIDCLRSLTVTQLPLKLQIVVVDNASTDDSVHVIANQFKNIHLIRLKSNQGYSGGYNIGIQYSLDAKADYIFVLNNDTTVASDSLFCLLQELDRLKQVKAVSPKIYFAPGYEYHYSRYNASDLGKVIWYAGGKIDWLNMIISHKGVDEVDRGQFNHDNYTDFVSGCAFLASASLFRSIGLFDERYYLYFEDIDLSMRIKKSGLKLRFVHAAHIWHKNAGSSSSGSALHDYYMTRNRFLFGMLYAPVSTKLALVKENLKLLYHGRKWQRQGIRDVILQRWGKGSYA